MFVVIVFGSVLIAYKTPFSYCDIPTTYKIGSIDSRFNINRAQAEVDISKAAEIFDAESDKNLFEYAPADGKVTINFVYDERTALMGDIEKQKSKIENLDSSLQGKINKYETDVKNFLQELDNFNKTVEAYNKSNEITKEDYDRLVGRQKELQNEGESLNRRADELNLETSNFNTSINRLNQNVDEFNDALVEKPEEGLYDAETNTITIFFVNSKNELLHTIAHEFGHALGMNHVQNNKAIMYPESSEFIEVTEEDAEEIDRVCKSFPLLTHWVKESIYKLQSSKD